MFSFIHGAPSREPVSLPLFPLKTVLFPGGALPLAEAFKPLASLLELLINRVGRESFPANLALTDASWVGYRLAEILPLPLPIKQSMLEINDADVRLTVLARFLKQQGLL